MDFSLTKLKSTIHLNYQVKFCEHLNKLTVTYHNFFYNKSVNSYPDMSKGVQQVWALLKIEGNFLFKILYFLYKDKSAASFCHQGPIL
jgi:hypothetical protein